jgi:hypothetical protein
MMIFQWQLLYVLQFLTNHGGYFSEKTLHLAKLWLAKQGLSGNCELWLLPTPTLT